MCVSKTKQIVLIGPLLRNLVNFRGELIEKLILEGNNVTLVSSDAASDNPLMPKGTNGYIVEVDRRGTKAIKDFKQILAYYNILKRTKPDVVLLYTTKCAIYAGMACRWLNIPYIVNNSGLIDMSTMRKPVEHILRILYKVGYGGASCMMYQNNYERNYLNGILGKDIRYIDIPGSGVNLEKFQYTLYPSQDDGIIFNYVARIAKFKGIEEYLECARRIHTKYPNTRFRIYGNYEESGYKDIIDVLSNKKIVEYKGRKQYMIPEIASCHAVIHPSHYEGLTNVILEHGAMGRVCIASNIPGCKEAITNSVTGYLFPMGDVDTLVDVVEKFINQPHHKKVEMGLLARAKMEKEFDRKMVTQIYLNEIKRILKTK